MRCTYGALGCVGYVLLMVVGGMSGLDAAWPTIPAAYLAAIVLAVVGAVLAVRDRAVRGWRQGLAVGVGVVLPTVLVGFVALLAYALSQLSFE
jgi:hypothetical protein